MNARGWYDVRQCWREGRSQQHRREEEHSAGKLFRVRPGVVLLTCTVLFGHVGEGVEWNGVEGEMQ